MSRCPQCMYSDCECDDETFQDLKIDHLKHLIRRLADHIQDECCFCYNDMDVDLFDQVEEIRKEK